jgi:CDP-diacylglycerol--glycerol-3-phosphate 3-phosphatidyltransferase
VVNIANGLTLLRLVLVPVFGVLLLEGTGTNTRLAAAIVFVLASITDQVDGHLARSRGLVTNVGIIADPIADKALTGTALIGLSVLGELAWWVSIVILAREVLITGLRLAVLRQAVIPASRGGKAKTATQVVAITLYLLPLPAVAQPAAAAIMGLALVLTVLTGVDYLVRVVRLPRPGHSQQGRA